MPKIENDFTTPYTISTFKSDWNFTAQSTITITMVNQAPALTVSGNKNHIMFNGDISATYGTTMSITGFDNSIHFGKSAYVYSTQGIVASHGVSIFNEGYMYGGFSFPASAFVGSAERDVFVNRGEIIGSLSMGAGDDLIDARHGTISQAILGGLDDDVLITDDSGVFLTEDADAGFFDTVKSTVNYQLSANVEKLVLLGKKNLEGAGNEQTNYLYGNSGNNILRGHGDDDNLFGSKGSDRLFGGQGTDYFFFKTGNGKETIMDFEEGLERINLREWNSVDSFSDVKRHASDHGADVWIEIGRDTIVIKDMHKADLDSLYFFV